MSERETKDAHPRTELEKALGRIAELEEENRRLRQEVTEHGSLLRVASESLIVARDGRLVFFNPSFAEMVSYSPTEFTAADFIQFAHPEDRACLMRRYAEALATGAEAEEAEFRTIAKNGAVSKRFERDFLCQGPFEDRPIEETLERGWEVLRALPEEALSRVHRAHVERYFPEGQR